MSEGNDKFVRRGECERVHEGLDRRLESIEQKIDKMIDGLTGSKNEMVALRTKIENELAHKESGRQAWGAWKLIAVITIINVIFTVALKAFWP